MLLLHGAVSGRLTFGLSGTPDVLSVFFGESNRRNFNRSRTAKVPPKKKALHFANISLRPRKFIVAEAKASKGKVQDIEESPVEEVVEKASPALALTEAEVLIEIPRWGFIKRKPDGSIDFISILPTPFNYGCIPTMMQEDGDPLDVVVLGRRLPRGHVGTYPVYGIVKFVDAGDVDDKVICNQVEEFPYRMDRLALASFFTVYAGFKRILNGLRGKKGETAFKGLQLRPPEMAMKVLPAD